MSSFCISICIHSLLKVGRIILSITALEEENFHFRPMRAEYQKEIDQSQTCKMQNRPALGQRCTTGELKYIYLQLENIEQCSVLTMIATICHLSSRIIVLTRAQLRQLNSVVGMGTHVWLLRMGSCEFNLFLMDFYIKMILHCCFWKYLEIKDIYTHESRKQAVKNKQFCKYFDESS